MTQYSERDIKALDRQGNYYSRHVSAMTGEGLHDKSDIAAELAWRDERIDELAAHVERVREASVGLHNLMTVAGSSAEHYLYKMFDALEERPETSLARLKAQWQADALQELYNQYQGVGMIRRGALLDKAIELQEEAEGGEA